jgi:hypothetical protein
MMISRLSWHLRQVNTDHVRGIGLTLLLIFSTITVGVPVLGTGATGTATAASTITVDTSGGADYTSIQHAVDNATTGDTIEVHSGTYHESIQIDTTVTITAPNGATIDGAPLSSGAIAFTILGQAAPEINGFTITGYSSGLYARGTGGSWTLRDTTIRNSSFGGVRAQDSTGDWVIENSVIRDDQNDAVDAHNTSGSWTIRDSTFTSRVYAESTTGQWLIDGVTIKNTSYAASIVARNSDSAWTVRDTTLTEPSSVGIDASGSTGNWQVHAVTISNASNSGVSAFSASGDWEIRDSTIQNSTDAGVEAFGTSGAWSIHENSFENNGVGVSTGSTNPTGDATRNWWGACDGPSGDFNGSGDGATGNLAVKPYYTNAAQTTLSNETTSPCTTSPSYDFDVELWDTSATVTQGTDVTIEIGPRNNLNQPVSGTTVELLVDANNDGQYTSDEVVDSQNADFGATEYRRFNLTYSNVQLAAGDYDYIGRIRADGDTTDSFTTGTLTVQAGNGSSGSGDTIISSSRSSLQAAPDDTIDITYTITNPANSDTTVLVEFPNLPANLSLQSVSGDVGQNLTGSTPPGLITSQLLAGSSTTVTATIAVANGTPTGQALTVTAEGTIQAGGTTRTNTTTTDLNITTQDPIVTRFGGEDGEVDNLDLLSAVNAANRGEQVGGEPVTNLDILQLVNRVNQQS